MQRFLVILAFIAFIRLAQAQTEAPVLRRCKDVRMVPREEAQRGLPVEVRGVVLYKHGTSFVVDDESGLWVDIGGESATEPLPETQVGDLVEVSGHTAPGDLSSILVAKRVRVVGRQELPPARPASLAELGTGALDCQRVTVTGVVRVVERFAEHHVGPMLQFTIANLEGQMYFWFFDRGAEENPERFVDAEVQVAGVCATLFNSRGEITSVRLLTSNAPDLQVIKPGGLGDAFSLPLTPLQEISGFPASTAPLHMRRVEGVLTYLEPGRFLYLQTGSRGVRVETRQRDVFPLGTVLEAAGFIVTGHHYAEMTEAILRFKSDGTVPAPAPATRTQIQSFPVSAPGEERNDYDGRLVVMRGRLVSFENVPGRPGRLFFENEGSLVPATLAEGMPADALATIPPGSELELTGICKLTFQQERLIPDKGFAPMAFAVLLRSADDVRVVRAAPWWTARRLAIALALSLFGLLLALVWVRVLRHLVATRSRQLAQEVRARRDAEVDFQATQRERTRLAADLHDTMAQTLTGMALQLESAEDFRDQDTARSAYHLGLARQLLTRSREDVQRNVFNLRANPLEGGSLQAALQRVADDRALGLPVRISVEADSVTLPIPDFIAGNLLLIAQEAISNALKHAKPQDITLCLSVVENGLTLVIRDDGTGFDPDLAPGIQQGHFGLQGMRERMKRLGGTLTIESAPSSGTLLTARVPIRTDVQPHAPPAC